MKNFTIRQAKLNDITAIIELCAEHAAYEKAQYDRINKVSALKISLFSKAPKLCCLVVEKSDAIIGYTTYMKQFSTWDANFYFYMDCLYLQEEARGKGLGKMMMEEIKKHALKENCNLQWQTPQFNTNAIEFYDAIGAEHKTKERFFWNVIEEN